MKVRSTCIHRRQLFGIDESACACSCRGWSGWSWNVDVGRVITEMSADLANGAESDNGATKLFLHQEIVLLNIVVRFVKRL